MPVPEPYGISGLWAAVKPLTQWPQVNEDMVEMLGLGWTNAGIAFFPAGENSDPTLNAAWPDDDDNGKNYKPKVAATRTDTKSAAAAMHRLGYLATAFSEDVRDAKEKISAYIDANAILYQLATIPGLWGDYSFEHDVVRDVADKTNEFLRKMASRIEARNAGSPETERPTLDGPGLAGAPIPPYLGGGRRRGPKPRRRNSDEVGAQRENRVAELTGGKVAGEPGKPGLKITKPGAGTTDVDVIGSDGSYIAVGGPAKAKNIGKLAEKLHILKYAADQKGVPARAYFEEGTPEPALQIARRILGPEFVQVFR